MLLSRYRYYLPVNIVNIFQTKLLSDVSSLNGTCRVTITVLFLFGPRSFEGRIENGGKPEIAEYCTPISNRFETNKERFRLRFQLLSHHGPLFRREKLDRRSSSTQNSHTHEPWTVWMVQP